ncbi:uncharacterized protein LOC117100524 isoform X2 [Anneissia japonica]|nr:uncharacterized protein LOC117100524 isoform X2 [Anneissia japonica]XP_033096167.1 uncharacterized protein LOC117100524 isoform X2 [Anneissia japonica]XP_033096168.1 uncharacterized protein LOC117100524 isoform X2 [Anneissia japonica]
MNQSRFFSNVTIIEGRDITNYLVLQDFIQGIYWFIYPDIQECYTYFLPVGMKLPSECVKDNAEYLNQFNDPGDVLVIRWQYEYDYESDGEKGEGPTDFTVNGCIKSGGSFVGTWESDGFEVDVIYGFTYYNFEVLTDVSEYFILPSYCNATINVG